MAAGDETRMLAVVGSPVAPELARTLDLAGYTWKAIATADEAGEVEPASGWQAFVVDCTSDAESAFALCGRFSVRCVTWPSCFRMSSSFIGSSDARERLHLR